MSAAAAAPLRVKNFLRGPWGFGATDHDGPVPHKLFPGENADPKARKAGWTIVGIIDFLNRTGQGFSPRGIPLYLFHPMDVAYPPFVVAARERLAQNMIAAVAFEHWNDKWPRGGIQKLWGSVGDVAIERRALLARVGVGAAQPVNAAAQEIVTTRVYEDDEDDGWDEVFNIDPTGCEDVDDVLGWRRCDDGAVEFMIAIANVAAWIPAGGALDVAARAAGQTIYEDGSVVQPMLPTAISAGAASLRADGRTRPVIAYVFLVRDGGVERAVWKECNVRVRRAFTYDSVLEDQEICRKIQEYLGAVLGRDVGPDPHIWIEQAMILYNRRVAEMLAAAGGGLLRRHAGSAILRESDYSAIAERSGCAEIAFLGSAAGEYCAATSVDGVEHAGLGLAAYTHASSPLRRYADLVNQRWIRHITFGHPRPADEEGIAWHLNERGRCIKKLERDLWFLAHLRTDAITEVDGIVLRETKGGWRVYVPVWRRTIRAICGDGVVNGDRVVVRAYCDLKRTSWDNRIVCSAAIQSGATGDAK